MPDTVCPRCRRVGLVRRERILKGDDSRVGYYCGACHHAWTTIDRGKRRKQPKSGRSDPPTGDD